MTSPRSVPRFRSRSLHAATWCAALLLAGCVAGPDYRKPELELPVTWKVDTPWRESRPDDNAPKGPWWQRFGDAQLNALAEQALANN
ncbi:MAG TPA: RND transporter, partial [Burkholderiaceae bacterium]|nr:RND transporter [Burkholderiaceae bacterium]